VDKSIRVRALKDQAGLKAGVFMEMVKSGSGWYLYNHNHVNNATIHLYPEWYQIILAGVLTWKELKNGKYKELKTGDT